MKSIKRYLCLSLCLTLILSSCHGQSDTSSIRQIKQSTASEKAVDTDALFFHEGQLCQHLRQIFQDRKGNLWFGTNVYDLMLYDGDSLSYLSDDEGYIGGRVTGIVEAPDGMIYFGTSSGLNQYDGKSFSLLDSKDGLGDHEIWSLMIDSKEQMWIGHNDGVSIYDGEQFTELQIPKPDIKEPNTIYSYDRITDIVEDRHGDMWMGTDGYGLCHYDGTSFTFLTEEDGLVDNVIGDLMMDSKGRLWIGTYFGGVSMYDGAKFHNFTQQGDVDGVEVGAFYEDGDGMIWFGVENNGVYRYDGQDFHHYYKESNLDGSILSIFKDDQERFWFGGWGGLFRFDGMTFTSVTKDGPWE